MTDSIDRQCGFRLSETRGTTPIIHALLSSESHRCKVQLQEMKKVTAIIKLILGSVCLRLCNAAPSQWRIFLAYAAFVNSTIQGNLLPQPLLA
jgi:hypothetical protein